MIFTVTPIFSAAKHECYSKELIKAGIGVILLITGIALISYGFIAPAANSSSPSQAVSSLPDLKTLALLLGGAAAVVVSIELAIRNKSTNANSVESASGRTRH
jgi:uncharacterized membrane protein